VAGVGGAPLGQCIRFVVLWRPTRRLRRGSIGAFYLHHVLILNAMGHRIQDGEFIRREAGSEK
jgi:hypothetical protein